VRTPLGILRSSAQMLERQPDLGERERELTGFIISETDRLNRLVSMLLECASPRAPDFKPHGIHAIAGHVLDLLASRAEGRGVQLQRELTAQHSILVCDREQLIQVFLNLVINALHFVPAGGRIVIATRNEQGSIVVSVSDDGPGLPAELRQRVFDPFFTRREGGIGLGLTIVQQIVQVHNGEIRMTESPWGGACFTIRFDSYDEGNER
jgi:signal transduction histidine kinase